MPVATPSPPLRISSGRNRPSLASSVSPMTPSSSLATPPAWGSLPRIPLDSRVRFPAQPAPACDEDRFASPSPTPLAHALDRPFSNTAYLGGTRRLDVVAQVSKQCLIVSR